MTGSSREYEALTRHFGLATDLYELTMAQAYFDQGMRERATFSLFIRTLPRDWGYFVFAGVEGVLSALEAFRYSPEAIDFLRSTGLFSGEFLSFLAGFRFQGDVVCLPEGEVFFPGEPLLEVSGDVIEAQLVETAVINRASFATLAASKAARFVAAAPVGRFVDFAARRTQTLEAGLTVARSSYLAGFAGTSNVLAGEVHGLPIFGTMAHSFVTCFDREIDAFRAFVETYPEKSTLLVDTYDTLEGVDKAIVIARELARRGYRLQGVRLDSGDLCELARNARIRLDDAGFHDATILASGGLDEHQVAELVQAGAPIDIFGVGTALGVVADAPALDIAYKLVDYGGKPRIKLSSSKETLAGRKQVYRLRDGSGAPREELLATREEVPPGSEWGAGLLQPLMEEGARVSRIPSLEEARATCRRTLERLPDDMRKIRAPTTLAVRRSAALESRQAEAERSLH